LQLQTVLELEGKQRVASTDKFEEHFRSVLSRLFDETSELKKAMLSQQVPRDIGSTNEFRTLRMELDREMKRRFDELDRCLDDTNHRFEETNRRFEDFNHRFEELGRSMNQISRSTHEPGMSEMARRLNDECAQRQMEDNAMHQLLTTLAEQTNIALEEEVSRLWEAIRTHNHDVMIDGADQPGQKSVQIQALASNGGFTGKSPRTIQLNQRAFSPRMLASHPPTQGSPMMGHPRNSPPQASPSMSPGGYPTHASATMSRSMQNLPANETSMRHQEVHQFVNQFSQHGTACNSTLGGGIQFRN